MTNPVLNKAIYKASYAINCNSHSDITNVIINMLYLKEYFGSNWTLDDEPITWDAIDGYIENMLDDGEQEIYIYIEQDSDLIDIISGTNWNNYPAEDEQDYEYHRMAINYDGKHIAINFAIN